MIQCKIFNRNYHFHLTHESLLKPYFAEYVSESNEAVTIIESVFVESIDPPEAKNIRKTNSFWITEDRLGGIGVYNMHQDTVIHAMTFDSGFRHIQLFSVPLATAGQSAELEHFKVGLAFALSILPSSGLVIHGSAIEHKGEAIIFSADSGIGKSTQSTLWKATFPEDVCLVNDDKPAILISQAKAMVFGNPFSGKHHLDLNQSSPLKAIVFLKRGAGNAIRKLPPKESVSLLLNHTTRFDYGKHQMNDYLALIEQLIRHVPMFELSCTVSEEAVHITKEAIFGGKG